MMKTALRRGGRLIAVTALATAFLGSTAGANDLPPAPEAPTVPRVECATVTAARNASINYTLTTNKTGSQGASATAHGDALVRVCWDLQVTTGATVNVTVHNASRVEGDAQAFAAASANPDGAAENDAEEVCVIADVALAAGADASAGATAKGNVSVAVVANASAPDAKVSGTEMLSASVDKTVPPPDMNGGEAGDSLIANTGVCVKSDGSVDAQAS